MSENRRHSSPRSEPDGGTVTRWTCVGGSDAAPPVEDVGHLLHRPEPRADPRLARGVADRLEELRIGDVAAVLDVLLPLRRDLAYEVAHRQHEVDLGVAERVERALDLRRRGAREDLVADDRGAVPLPDLLGERVPGADGLGLEAAPRQRHQVERGEEVRVEAVGGVEDVVPAEDLLVAEEDVLEVGRAGLGTARRGAPRACSSLHLPLARSCQPGSTSIPIARSSTCRSSGPDGPEAAARGSRSARSPTTG